MKYLVYEPKHPRTCHKRECKSSWLQMEWLIIEHSGKEGDGFFIPIEKLICISYLFDIESQTTAHENW